MVKNCYIVCVYRDTVEDHDENDNLADIIVEKDDLEDWLFNGVDNYYKTIEQFYDVVDGHTADDTIDLVDYLRKKGKDILVLSRY